jgi:hypothetical protein
MLIAAGQFTLANWTLAGGLIFVAVVIVAAIVSGELERRRARVGVIEATRVLVDAGLLSEQAGLELLQGWQQRVERELARRQDEAESRIAEVPL